MEILIHVGVDTVEMGGDGFSNAVSAGQTVKKGDLLLTMDLDKIRAAGHALKHRFCHVHARQQKEFVEHSDPNYTRANEVMDSREKNLFEGIDRYLELLSVNACSTFS